MFKYNPLRAKAEEHGECRLAASEQAVPRLSEDRGLSRRDGGQLPQHEAAAPADEDRRLRFGK